MKTELWAVASFLHLMGQRWGRKTRRLKVGLVNSRIWMTSPAQDVSCEASGRGSGTGSVGKALAGSLNT